MEEVGGGGGGDDPNIYTDRSHASTLLLGSVVSGRPSCFEAFLCFYSVEPVFPTGGQLLWYTLAPSLEVNMERSVQVHEIKQLTHLVKTALRMGVAKRLRPCQAVDRLQPMTFCPGHLDPGSYEPILPPNHRPPPNQRGDQPHSLRKEQVPLWRG